MAENKKSVLLYCDIIHTIKSLTDDEAGRLFKHYLKYINDLNPESDRLTELLFEPIKQNLKRDLIKWMDKSERNSLIAKDGWVKRKDANAYERKKYDAIYADKEIVTDTVKDKVINNKYDFLQDLLNYGFKENLAHEWLKVRKTKKATNTKTAFDKFIVQIELSKMDKNAAIEKCIEKSWSGFNAEWILNDATLNKPKQTIAPDYAKFLSGE